MLRSLHWLPVRQRVIFKIATLMYRCLNGLAPSYLAADCTVVSAIYPVGDSCDLPPQGSCTFQEQEQWHLDRGHSRSAVQQSRTIFPLGWKIHLWVLTHFENCLRHSILFDKWLLHERICGSCINLRGEMFIIIIIIIINYPWIIFLCFPNRITQWV